MSLARLRPLRGLRAIRRAYSTHRLEVPVIDLAGSDAAVASEVASACEEWRRRARGRQGWAGPDGIGHGYDGDGVGGSGTGYQDQGVI